MRSIRTARTARRVNARSQVERKDRDQIDHAVETEDVILLSGRRGYAQSILQSEQQRNRDFGEFERLGVPLDGRLGNVSNENVTSERAINASTTRSKARPDGVSVS